MDPMYMRMQDQPYTMHHNMVCYSGPRHASQSKLSDNIMTDVNGSFSNPDITLQIRQQPQEALVLSAGKEKSRKPVDPPPIVQLKVNEDIEASRHFLQSPHLFMVADLWKADKDERWDDRGSSLYGGLCSSLHRLKDVDNKDGGFFIFADISIKATGSFRLQFKLYDLQKEHNAAVFMSRTFADQGVRLRLRKEPRAFAAQKRPYYEDESPQLKRYRADTEDRNSATLPQTGGHTSSHTSSLPADYTSSHTSGLQPDYTSSHTSSLPSDYTSSHTSGLQPDYTSSYTPGLQPNYTSSYARLPQPSYTSQYLQASSSPYYQVRPTMETRSYPVGQYSGNLNLGSMPPSSISQSNVSQYPELRSDDAWTVPEQPSSWQNQPSSAP